MIYDLLSLRDGVAAKLRAELTQLKECVPHPGRFDLTELANHSMLSPSLRIGMLGMQRPDAVHTSETDYPFRLAAYVTTADQPKKPRDVTALEIVNYLLTTLPGRQWGGENVLPIQALTVTADNLYSSKVGNKGVSLWAVTWLQPIRLGGDDLVLEAANG